MRRNILIIGAGIAGVHLSKLLSESEDNRVMLISGEHYLPYYRMRLDKILEGSSPDSIKIHDREWYMENNIELIHQRALSFDPEKKMVGLENGSAIKYDVLVLATGAKAFIPPVEGKHKCIASLRSMDDALFLREKLLSAESVAIVGGGVLGIEAAITIAGAFPIKVHVIESSPYVLSKMIDSSSSSYLESILESRGIVIHKNARLTELRESSLVLEDSEIDADVVLFSTGVRADKSLAERAGLENERGIKVDGFLETSADGIYAIGDAAEFDGNCFGLALYAREMAEAAARNINGEKSEYVPSSPSFLLSAGGISVSSAGALIGDRHSESSGDSLKTYFVENGILRGAVLINALSSIQKVSALIDKPYIG